MVNHQESAYDVLSRYVSFNGKRVLEVGGAQSCESAYPFLRGGAACVVVTGLDHVWREENGENSQLLIRKADALSLSRVFEPSSFDAVYGISVIEHIPSPKAFLAEVYKILKPGGLAYLQGDPLWSSRRGHHLWIATWGGHIKEGLLLITYSMLALITPLLTPYLIGLIC
jgi:SAM-dependent methyltransferase